MAEKTPVQSPHSAIAKECRARKTRPAPSLSDISIKDNPSSELVSLNSLQLAGLADPSKLTPADILRLQHTAGNEAVQRLLDPTLVHGVPAPAEGFHLQSPDPSLAAPSGAATIQRLMTLQDWEKLSKPGRKDFGAAFKKIDDAIKEWHKLKDDDDINKRDAALKAVDQAVTDWKTSLTGPTPKTASPELQAQVGTFETDLKAEKDKFVIVKYISDQYGVLIKQSKGKELVMAEIMAAGKSKGQATARTASLKAVEWTVEELQDLKVSLDNYAPALKAKKGAGDQPLKTMSRENIYHEVSGTGGVTKKTGTMGVTFMGREHISMFEKARSPYDFATSAQQFRGTIEHELSHALVEGPKMAEFLTASPFWRDSLGNKSQNNSKYWDVTGGKVDQAKSIQKAKKAGVEPPPTEYGVTTAGEDLAESLMIFFEDPARLAKAYPGRFNFISIKAAPLISAAAIKKAGTAGVAAAAAEIGAQPNQYNQLKLKAEQQLEFTIRFRDLARRAALEAAEASVKGEFDKLMDKMRNADSSVQNATAAHGRVVKIREQLDALLKQNQYLLSGWASMGSETAKAQPGDKGVADQAKIIADTNQQINDAQTAVKGAETKAKEAVEDAQRQVEGIEKRQSISAPAGVK